MQWAWRHRTTMIRPHPDADSMTADEIRAAITQAEDQLRLAREIDDTQASTWFEQEIRGLEAALARRNGESSEKPRQSQADILVELVAESGAELFRTPTAEPFATFAVNAHKETWPIRSKATRRWMIEKFYRLTGKAPNSEAMQAALNVVEAMAMFSGKQHEVHLRTAWHQGALYYDLADGAWQAIRIAPDGWELVATPPVRFRRYSHTASQVMPARAGSVEALWNFLNIKDPRDRRLVEAWLVAGFIPDIPRPVLVTHGDQGSAKSTACKMLLSLVDPSATPCLRTRDATELVQALAHRFAAVLDNVSGLPDWLSDLLCCAVTGDGFTKRMLFTDDDDVIYSYRRALLFNGINIAISKPDLLDRSLLVQLERIPDNRRRDEAELWQRFGLERRKILGAIFTRLARAIRDFDTVRPSHLPRMADFARWAISATADSHQFLRDYAANVERQTAEAVGESMTATVLLAWLEGKAGWSGQPHELHAELKQHAGSMKIPERQFPATPSALGKKLREVRPNLIALGWNVESPTNQRPRMIHITRINGESPVGPDGPDGTAKNKENFTDRSQKPADGPDSAPDGPGTSDSRADGTDGSQKSADAKNPNNFNGPSAPTAPTADSGNILVEDSDPWDGSGAA